MSVCRGYELANALYHTKVNVNTYLANNSSKIIESIIAQDKD